MCQGVLGNLICVDLLSMRYMFKNKSELLLCNTCSNAGKILGTSVFPVKFKRRKYSPIFKSNTFDSAADETSFLIMLSTLLKYLIELSMIIS